MAKKEAEQTGGKWERRSGEFSGFDVRGNDYRVAPMYVTRFDEIHAEREGVRLVVADVAKFAAERNSQIAKQTSRLWKNIAQELGINQETHNMSYQDGIVTAIEKAKPSDDKGSLR